MPERKVLRVAFLGETPADLAQRIEPLLKVKTEFVLIPRRDEDALVAVLPGVDVLVSFSFTKRMAAAGRRLKLVQVPGAGLDRLDPTAIGKGVHLANAYGHDNAIAEYVIGAMLCLTRGFCQVDTALRQGRWEGSWVASAPPWPELSGKAVGLVGYGRIGRRVGQLAKGFGVELWAIRRHPDPGTAVEDGLAFLGGPQDLRKLLERSDYLVIAAPLTPETRGMIGSGEFLAMKRTAYLVNVARAEIIEERALFEALKKRTIAAAALDVWYRYPTGKEPIHPSDFPFHELPNVLMTSHMSSWAESTLDNRAKLIAENIERVARGDSPLNLVATG